MQARRSVTEKKKLLTEWQLSTLTMREFCVEKDISLSGLKTWIKQFDMGRKRYLDITVKAVLRQVWW